MRQVCFLCGKDVQRDHSDHDCLPYLLSRVKELEDRLEQSEERRDAARAALIRVVKRDAVRLLGDSEKGSGIDDELSLQVQRAVEQTEEERREIARLRDEMRLLADERTDYLMALMIIRNSASGNVSALKGIATETLREWRGHRDPAFILTVTEPIDAASSLR